MALASDWTPPLGSDDGDVLLADLDKEEGRSTVPARGVSFALDREAEGDVASSPDGVMLR